MKRTIVLRANPPLRRWSKKGFPLESFLTDEIEKSIIRQSIHKIVMNKQVISFLSVVIKYKISFSFHVKYPLSYKPFQTSGDDDSDDIDENDKITERKVKSLKEQQLSIFDYNC